MKNKTEPTLEELKKEIESLKLKKQKKLAISTSMTERNKLLREINELEMAKKSPNALRSFGRTFGRGLKMTGKTLWKGLSRASRNLDKNAPEIKEFSKTMTSQPKPSRQPNMDIDDIFFPRSIQKPLSKKKKLKRRKQKARKMVYQQKQDTPSWGFP